MEREQHERYGDEAVDAANGSQWPLRHSRCPRLHHSRPGPAPLPPLALQEPNGAYIVFNMGELILPQGYQGEGIILEGDIAAAIGELDLPL